MRGLLLKDILNLKQQVKIYLVIVAVWLIVSIINTDANFFTTVMMVFTILIPITASAYDEKAKWDSYALTMTVSKSDLVLSKYLLAFLCALTGGILSVILGVALSNNIVEVSLSSMLFLSMGMIIVSIILPFVFKFGAEKGRLVLIVFFIAPTLFSMFVTKLNIPMPSQEMIMKGIYFSPLVALLVTVCSIFISKSIYEHKEF